MIKQLREIFDAITKYYRDEKLLKEGLCSLHECKFVSGEIPIKYGRIAHSKEYLDSRNHLFPCAMSFAVGGCYVAENSPKTTSVGYCKQCRAAESEYLASRNLSNDLLY